MKRIYRKIEQSKKSSEKKAGKKLEKEIKSLLDNLKPEKKDLDKKKEVSNKKRKYTKRVDRTLARNDDGLNFVSPILEIKTMSQIIKEAKAMPTPNQLLDVFWIEGELAILFASPGNWKTMLAYQSAYSIASGEQINGFKMGATPQKILYCDFELTQKQVENRYSKNYRNTFKFHNNLKRVSLTITKRQYSLGFNTYEEYLVDEIRKSAEHFGAKIIIIDNLTKITDTLNSGVKLVEALDEIKRKYQLSILVVAHTPKIDLRYGLNQNHIAGSKKIGAICDSAFGIVKSTKDSSIRYIKSVKVRNAEEIYNAENVALCKLVKRKDNFMHLEIIGTDEEVNHIEKPSKESKQMLENDIIQMHNQGLSTREIAKLLGLNNHMIAQRAIEKWEKRNNL